MSEEQQEKRLWDTKETAEYLGLKPFTVQRMATDGRLPHIELPGGRNLFRFDPDQIVAWTQQRQICYVLVRPEVEAQAMKEGEFYKAGERLPGGVQMDLGVFIGPRESAELFQRLYGGVIVIGLEGISGRQH